VTDKTPQDNDRLLLEMHSDVRTIREAVGKIERGDAPVCARHDERLKRVEDTADSLANRVSSVSGRVWGLVAAMLLMLTGLLAGIVTRGTVK